MVRLRIAVIAAILAVASAVLASPARAESGLESFLASHHADVGSSVPLGDGRVLWLFGDTVNDEGPWDRNSAAVQEGGTVTRLPGTFLQPSAPGHWYWPGEAVREGARVRILAQDFTCDDPCGPWDFRYVRTDILTYRLTDLVQVGKVSLPRRDSGAMWSQIYKAQDGYTYAYGSYSVPGELGKAIEVAQVRTGYVWCVKCWRYLGTRMTPEMELGTVSSVVRNPGGGYRLYSKRLDLWSDEIIAYDSATPYGPWRSRQVVAVTPQGDGKWTYAVEVHPEQRVGSWKLMLTYATNCDQLCPDYRVTPITVDAF